MPAPEIPPRVPHIAIIDLELGEALQQRRQAFREKNYHLREIYEVVIGRAQNRGISENEISNTETIILHSESEIKTIFVASLQIPNFNNKT